MTYTTLNLIMALFTTFGVLTLGACLLYSQKQVRKALENQNFSSTENEEF